MAGSNQNKTYLIAGSTRGIGLELVNQLSADPSNTVIGTSRSESTSGELSKLAASRPNVHVVTLDISSQASIDKLAAQVEKITDSVDVLVANGAVAYAAGPILEVSREAWVDHLTINTVGPVFVFKAVYPLLKKGTDKKVVLLSSVAGSISTYPFQFSTGPYGQSKAAVNHTTKAIAAEFAAEGFKLVLVHPGTVSTDMYNDHVEKIKDSFPDVATAFPSITPEESVRGILKVVDGLLLETSGSFFGYDGVEIPF